MREFEFSKAEAVLAKDDSWRRLFARVAPSVRRDMMGWLGLVEPVSQASENADTERLRDVLTEYLSGAALVVDLLPDQEYAFVKNDSDALDYDMQDVSLDARRVYEALHVLSERINDSGRRASEDARSAEKAGLGEKARSATG